MRYEVGRSPRKTVEISVGAMSKTIGPFLTCNTYFVGNTLLYLVVYAWLHLQSALKKYKFEIIFLHFFSTQDSQFLLFARPLFARPTRKVEAP